MRLPPLWAFLALVSLAPLVHAGDDSVYIEPEKRIARLKTVVPPEYPAQALKAGEQATVDVEGTIGPLWTLESPKVTSNTPAAQAFIKSVEEVLPLWSFQPKTGSDCAPGREPVAVRVHFEIEAGTPHIYVTHAKDGPRDEERGSDYKPVSRVEPSYPREMIRRNVMATVYAIVAIAPSGKVLDVETKGYPLVLPAGPETSVEVRRRIEDAQTLSLLSFERVVQRAFLQWTFPPIPDERIRRACYDILFRLKN